MTNPGLRLEAVLARPGNDRRMRRTMPPHRAKSLNGLSVAVENHFVMSQAVRELKIDFSFVDVRVIFGGSDLYPVAWGLVAWVGDVLIQSD
jgi:hypothetical protein